MIADWQRVTHRLLGRIQEELADLGLSPAEVNVLACLHDADPPTIRRLSEATAQPPSTLTGLLDRLERRGLTERRPNPRDRRSILVAPTPAGRAAATRVHEAFARVEARLPRSAVTRLPRLLEELERSLGRPI